MILGFGQVGKLADELVEAYSLRAVTMLNVIAQAHDVMDDLRQSWHGAYLELGELLASHSSLRRKDFELLMRRLVELQRQREKLLKDQLRRFAAAQADITMKLKSALHARDLNRVSELKDDVQRELDTLTRQLTAFQREQGVIVERLRSLVAKGAALTIKELKDAANS